MEFAVPEEPIHSPLRNVTGGAGCGCGCLGMLVMLVSSIGLAAIPLEMYAEGPGNAGMWSVFGITVALLFMAMGVAAFVGSLFMD